MLLFLLMNLVYKEDKELSLSVLSLSRDGEQTPLWTELGHFRSQRRKHEVSNIITEEDSQHLSHLVY